MHVAIAPLIGFLCALSENSHSSEILFPSFRRLKAFVKTSVTFKHNLTTNYDTKNIRFNSVGWLVYAWEA